MKWLKLDCDFRNDPKIRALAHEWGGQEAAGFWTLLMGFVGAHGGTQCRVKIDPLSEYSDVYIADWFSTKPQVLFRRLSRAAQLSLICPTEWENNRTIFIPNMLKRLDDYTRRVRTNSEQSPKKPTVEEEVRNKKEKREEDKTHTSPSGDRTAPRYTAEFETFWSLSTKRGPKIEAFKAWQKLQPSSQLIDVIHAGMHAWKASTQWQDETKQPHVFRWLNRRGWEEVVPRSPAKLFGESHGEADPDLRAAKDYIDRRMAATVQPGVSDVRKNS